MQPTQFPAPLQSKSPFIPHAVPDDLFGFDGTPAVHTSSVQSLLSTGTSASLVTSSVCPAPSHTVCRQSPAWAAGFVPHMPASHVRSMHAFPVAGQSDGTEQIAPPVPP
jgi:hypothetical protein